ncbi:Protein FAM8A1 [Operophtera brumata]|uniref:Protein FAM8A1 n=1 Tax=Operophtera brumata TaxID=104452 RepID=A0A0L7LQT7_OPEBR|nr:Protein FAM8A1 [Operophtera brumata]
MSDTERLTSNDGPSAENANREGQGDGPPVVSEREEYFQALQLWIQLAQMYQNLSTCFPYYMMTVQGLHTNPTNVPLLNNNYQFHAQQFPFQVPIPPRPNVPENLPQQETLLAAEVIARNGGYEYIIPPLYKRLAAEFIDFMLLFILKLIVTFVVVDMFDLIDVEKFDFYKFTENYDDYKFAMELTSDILFLEVIYRIIVCIYEAFCLCGAGRTGGATPGKALLGLRVVTVSAVIPVEGRPKETVLLYPGKSLTFLVALVRSFMKNFLISLLFPLCVVLFVFRHNRTGYDLLCGVIVVEENMYPARRFAP